MNVTCSIFKCSVHRYCGNAYLITSSSSNEPLHQCDECGRIFFSRPKLSRHVCNVHGDRVFCLQCSYSVPKTRSYQLRKHEEIVHNKTKLSVEIKKSAYILPETTTVRPLSCLYSDISSVISVHRWTHLICRNGAFQACHFLNYCLSRIIYPLMVTRITTF